MLHDLELGARARFPCISRANSIKNECPPVRSIVDTITTHVLEANAPSLSLNVRSTLCRQSEDSCGAAQAACLAVCVGIPLTVSDVAPQQAGVIEAVVAVLSVGTTALEAKVRRGVSVSVCRYLWLYINHTSSNALDASSYAAPPSTFGSSQVHHIPTTDGIPRPQPLALPWLNRRTCARKAS
eukprot:8631688-Pyramimonas_sp.AAC.3